MTTAFCSYQERIMDKRQIVHAALEGARQGNRNLDRRVGVIALAHVQEPRNAADVAEVQLVEAVLAAGQGQDYAILGYLLGKLGVVVAARLGAVAAADQEEVLDRTTLDRLDDLVGHAEYRVVPEAHQDLLARSVSKAGERQRLFDYRREVPAFNMLDAGPGHQTPGERRPV